MNPSKKLAQKVHLSGMIGLKKADIDQLKALTVYRYQSLYTTMLFFFILGSAFSSAYAYRSIGSIWRLGEGQSIPFVVNERLSQDVSDADALQAIIDGFNVWNEVSCSYMRWRYDGRTTASGWGDSDGLNVVTWRENGWDDSSVALGITSTIFDFNGLIDTDIKYNGQDHRWGVLRSSDFGNLTDIGCVTVHESGHALGLDHSDVPTATMWPSALSGDISTRSLDQDDINGVCEMYPSGQAPPIVEPDPNQNPTQETVSFGEPCGTLNCANPYFCISDGQNQYCTQSCDQNAQQCPSGYYCAQLSSGSGACAQGSAPSHETAGFGEPCGDTIGCEQGLFCISDQVNGAYCSGPCDNDRCAEGYRCAELQGGGTVCAKGDQENLPSFGQPCRGDGACGDDLFCLTDQLFTDPQTGAVIPYCSEPCGMGCPMGYRCVEVGNNEDACQKVPTVPDQRLGDPCWINPENPTAKPVCVEGLICIQARFDSMQNKYVEPGICTQNCNPEQCCPIGWGCLGLTPLIAQCVEGKEDDVISACATEKQPLAEDDTTMETGGDIVLQTKSKDEGCQSRQGDLRSILGLMLLLLLALNGFMRRRNTI